MQSDIPPELQLGIIFSNSSTNSYWHCKVNHVSEPCPSHRKYWSSISSTMSSVSFPWNSTYKHFRDSETSLDPPEMIKKNLPDLVMVSQPSFRPQMIAGTPRLYYEKRGDNRLGWEGSWEPRLRTGVRWTSHRSQKLCENNIGILPKLTPKIAQ